MAITKKTALIGVALIVGLLTLVKFLWKPLQSESNKENVAQNQAMEQKQVRMATIKTNYKNPGGSDYVAFTLRVDEKGTITEAKTEILAVNPTSKMRQEAFAAALPQVLVGKDLSTLSKIDRVGGSSLTTGAFNASLDALKAQL